MKGLEAKVRSNTGIKWDPIKLCSMQSRVDTSSTGVISQHNTKMRSKFKKTRDYGIVLEAESSVM